MIDLTLRSDATGQLQVVDAPTKQRDAAVASHGVRAPPTPSTAANQHASASAASDETVHTTSKHPWLMVERGWVAAGDLHVGEQVLRLDGGTATITAVRVVPGAATMYNLQVGQAHTFAVGDGQYVVHNCADEMLNMTRGLRSDLRAVGADVSHMVIAVAKKRAGGLAVSINERVAKKGAHDFADTTAQHLQTILGNSKWAGKGLQ